MRKTFRKIVATVSAATLAIAMAVTAVPTDVAAETSKAGKKAAKAEFDADGTYHAYFGFQETGTWIFRDEWYSKTLGIDGKDLKKANLTYDNSTLFKSDTDGVTAVDGTVVTDAEITGNGTYTVGVSGLADCLNNNGDTETTVSMIYVSTDIPWSAKDNPVTISDVKLTCDGKELSLPEEPFFPSEYIDEAGLLRFDALNSYQRDKGEYADSPDAGYPADSIQITFTVSGFNSDNPDATGADTTSTTSDGTAVTTSDGTTTESSSSSPVVPIVIVVVVVAVVAVVVVKKKQQ